MHARHAPTVAPLSRVAILISRALISVDGLIEKKELSRTSDLKKCESLSPLRVAFSRVRSTIPEEKWRTTRSLRSSPKIPVYIIGLGVY